jgi:hypothetical protein
MTALCAGFAPLIIDLEALALYALLMGLVVVGLLFWDGIARAGAEMGEEE